MRHHVHWMRSPADTRLATVEASSSVRIKNISGLHARPCHAIASTAACFKSELRVLSNGQEVNGKSILELMTLCAPCDATLSFIARGCDADALIARLVALVETGFNELD